MTNSLLSTYRAQTSQLVTNVAVNTGENRLLIWQRIWARLEALYGIKIHSYQRIEGECLLSVAERYDLLNEVYSLAFAEHLYQQQYEE